MIGSVLLANDWPASRPVSEEEAFPLREELDLLVDDELAALSPVRDSRRGGEAEKRTSTEIGTVDDGGPRGMWEPLRQWVMTGAGWLARTVLGVDERVKTARRLAYLRLPLKAIVLYRLVRILGADCSRGCCNISLIFVITHYSQIAKTLAKSTLQSSTSSVALLTP